MRKEKYKQRYEEKNSNKVEAMQCEETNSKIEQKQMKKQLSKSHYKLIKSHCKLLEKTQGKDGNRIAWSNKVIDRRDKGKYHLRLKI